MADLPKRFIETVGKDLLTRIQAPPIYLLMEQIPYEGETTLGLYDSEEKAVLALRRYWDDMWGVKLSDEMIKTLFDTGRVKYKCYHYCITEEMLNEDLF